LAEEVQLGTFRSDLFFRLNVFPIEVPALRDRSGDVALLLRYVLQRLSTRLNQTLVIEAHALAALEAYSWPGNVRELENVVERSVYVCERGVIAQSDLPAKIQSASIQRLSRLDGAAPSAVQVDRAASTEAVSSLLEEGSKRNLRHESETAEANHILRVLRT